MRYPGGKGKCYQRLINLMPPHRVYIESHLGGGAVLRNKRPADVSIGIDIDAGVIARWRECTTVRCALVHDDALDYLSAYAFVGDELIYVDPPYVPSTRRQSRVYRHDYSSDDHRRLLDTLKRLPCMVMLSGYDSELYEKALPHWHRTSFLAKTHVGVREEHVWTNFEPPTRLHDGAHLGDSFRDRQTIKRRQQRFEDRFARMEPRERHELLRALNLRFGVASERCA